MIRHVTVFGSVRKIAKAALAAFGVAAVIAATGGAAQAMDPGYCQACRQAADEGRRSEWRDGRGMLLVYKHPILGIPVRHPKPAGNDPGCCPNSMLVCPLGRHFCK